MRLTPAVTIGLSSNHRKALEPVWAQYGLEVCQHVQASTALSEVVPLFNGQTGAVLLFIDNSLNYSQWTHYQTESLQQGCILVATTHNPAHHARTLRLQGFFSKSENTLNAKNLITDEHTFATGFRDISPEQLVAWVKGTEALTLAPNAEAPAEPQPKAEEPSQETDMEKPLSLIPKGNDATTTLDYDGVVGLLKDAIRILRDQYGVERIRWEKMTTLSIDRLTKDSHPV
jgi:hypothetical protein